MKEEIKEILEDVKRHLDYVEATKQASIRDNEMKVMYDYITNLQEEINKLTAESTEWESKCYDLQKELKEYKMIFDAFSKRPYAHRYLEEKKKELGNDKIIGLDSEMIYKDYYDLKEEKKISDKINIDLAYIDKEYLLDKEDVDRKINEIINRHNILVDKVSDYLKSKGE